MPTKSHFDNYYTQLCCHTQKYVDEQLNLGLAEHALLQANGWFWTVVPDKHAGFSGRLAWVPPLNHAGSTRMYFSRSHAINSLKKHTLRFNKGDAYSEI